MINLIIIIAIFSSILYLTIIILFLIGLLKSPVETTGQKLTVSVIISAHNESENIIFCIDDLLNQKYDKGLIEIILVNDRSTDNTGDIISKYAANNVLFKIITINNSEYSLSPKKYAITKAINYSKGEIILLTDADCRLNDLWISTMVSYFKPEVGAVAGSVILTSTAWRLSYFMVIDAIMNNLIIQGTLGWNFAVACKGGNFAYRRCVFNEINGFEGLEKSLSGDDDLFLQKISSQSNWKIKSCTIESAIVETSAPENYLHFFNQRKRHISASKYFNKIVQLSYSIYFFVKTSMLISFLCISFCIGFNNLTTYMLFLYLLTLLLLLYIPKVNTKKKYLFLYPLWEIYYVINHLFIGPFALLGKVKWGKR